MLLQIIILSITSNLNESADRNFIELAACIPSRVVKPENAVQAWGVVGSTASVRGNQHNLSQSFCSSGFQNTSGLGDINWNVCPPVDQPHNIRDHNMESQYHKLCRQWHGI